MQRLAILFILAAAAPAAAQQTSADSARVYDLSEVEVLPRPRNAADFAAALREAYPPHLRTAGVGGTVQVGFVVGPDGVPADVRVLATPDSGFNAPTVQAVSLLRFTPAQVGGRAVPVRVEQPILWRVEPEPDFVGQGVEVAEPGAGEYELEDVDDPPRILNATEFQRALGRGYPAAKRAAGTGAHVEARFLVAADGTIAQAQILSSSDPAFAVPTAQALRVLRFVPGRVAGRPVPTWVILPVEWSVDRLGPEVTLPSSTDDRRSGRPRPR